MPQNPFYYRRLLERHLIERPAHVSDRDLTSSGLKLSELRQRAHQESIDNESEAERLAQQAEREADERNAVAQKLRAQATSAAIQKRSLVEENERLEQRLANVRTAIESCGDEAAMRRGLVEQVADGHERDAYAVVQFNASVQEILTSSIIREALKSGAALIEARIKTLRAELSKLK